MEYLKEDLRRYIRNNAGFFRRIKIVLLTQGIWAIIVYRASSWCHRNKRRLFYLRLLSPFLTILEKVTEITTGISLPPTARIGKGLYIGHFGGIIVSPLAVIGDYCNLSQGVSIGQAGRGGDQKVPFIGDRVFIGPGAKLFGGIRIGNDVAIGANAVVTKNLPDMAVAVGVPAKIVSYKGSMDFVLVRNRIDKDRGI
ncbi:MAG: serine acetyltransferase [Syntrophaceae bacterium]|nr:serine acetyltransferase [Syntrophaceae bacterium]